MRHARVDRVPDADLQALEAVGVIDKTELEALRPAADTVPQAALEAGEVDLDEVDQTELEALRVPTELYALNWKPLARSRTQPTMPKSKPLMAWHSP